MLVILKIVLEESEQNIYLIKSQFLWDHKYLRHGVVSVNYSLLLYAEAKRLQEKLFFENG